MFYLQDRIMFACTAFVSNSLGQRFVEPPMLDLGDSLSDSVPHSPLLFILSAGNNQQIFGLYNQPKSS